MKPAKRRTPGLAGHEGADQTTKGRTHPVVPLRLTPKQERVLNALQAAAEWIWREALDRIAGTSNSPDVVLRLRRKLGEDAIDMQQVDAIDRDGRPCRPGRYRLSEVGRQRLAQIGGTP